MSHLPTSSKPSSLSFVTRRVAHAMLKWAKVCATAKRRESLGAPKTMGGDITVNTHKSASDRFFELSSNAMKLALRLLPETRSSRPSGSGATGPSRMI